MNRQGDSITAEHAIGYIDANVEWGIDVNGRLVLATQPAPVMR
jgi:hypothetical protein